MIYSFAKSSKGYSHINSKMPCQDFSALYKDPLRTIITCCDGHGGKIYVRSNIGSHMASNAVINVFNSITNSFFYGKTTEELENKIKLLILCEWNKFVEGIISKEPIRKGEVGELTPEQIETLKKNPIKAYGTTLTGALLYGNKMIVVGIGDTECLVVRKGELLRVLESEDDPVANVTYSMCQEDAFKYIRVKIINFKEVDGVILCTDGLTTPYQSYTNFNDSFVKPLVRNILETNSISHIDSFVDEMASKLGTGDDVSLAFIIDDKKIKKADYIQ